MYTLSGLAGVGVARERGPSEPPAFLARGRGISEPPALLPPLADDQALAALDIEPALVAAVAAANWRYRFADRF